MNNNTNNVNNNVNGKTIKLNASDIKQINMKLNTNIPQHSTIDFNLNILDLSNNPVYLKNNSPYYTDKFELVLEKFALFTQDEIYAFFFSRSVFQKRLNEVVLETSLKSSDEILNNNLLILFRLLFHTPSIPGNMKDSYSLLGGNTILDSDVMGVFKFVKGAIKDTFNSASPIHFNIGEKKYTLSRFIWLNDFINNPITKRLFFEYRKFKKWAIRSKPNEDWKLFFKGRRIWDNLETKDSSGSNPIANKKREVKKFLKRYPPFEEFFYKILKTYIPIITNEPLKVILSSKNTSHLIDLLESMDMFAEDGEMSNVNNVVSMLYGEITKKTNHSRRLTIETNIVIVEGKPTIYFLADFIEGAADTTASISAVTTANCSQRREKIINGVNSYVSSEKPKPKTQLTNESGIFSLSENKYKKFETEEKTLDEELGDYDVIVQEENIRTPEEMVEDRYKIIVANSEELKTLTQADFYYELKQGVDENQPYGKTGYDGIFGLVDSWKYFENNESEIIETLENLYKLKDKYSKKRVDQIEIIEKYKTELAKQSSMSGKRDAIIQLMSENIKKSNIKIKRCEFIVSVLNSMIKYENGKIEEPVRKNGGGGGGSKTMHHRHKKVKKTRKSYKL
uniref:Uncharacterized protein n=1 Tax=viral metagenome TaxID=1070528 RepID=A0A6C0DQP8_9ZZZZ